MKIGDTVKIYQKPLTEEDFEGKAILIKRLDSNRNNLEYWTVQFRDSFPVWRFIKKEV